VTVVIVPLKTTSSDLNRCPRKGSSSRGKSPRDVKTQTQVSKVVEVLEGVGERNPRGRGEVDVKNPKKGGSLRRGETAGGGTVRFGGFLGIRGG